MLKELGSYTVYLALLSGVPGIFFYFKLPNNKAKSLLVFIWIAFVIDFIGINFKEWTGYVNYPIYNFYILISFSYYIILLKLLLVKIKTQRIASLSLLFFIVVYFTNILFIQNNLAQTFTNVFALGVIIVLFLSCLYLFEIFSSENILNFKKSIFFWFIVGVLAFHVSFLPYMLAIHFLLIDTNDTILSFVLFILNLLMHSCFLIGFICSEKKYNY
ncbi:hypothetical protein FLCU109888_01160 [Flavobacterium cucumis]|jgi:hypothetical protein|uniref:YhhN-like protein n=1 Tax=Flavobacterium cucumis TaxID=416016 RepID=A0A1M7ZTG3_9FLAO|nr:hypothetical protein [Flavobacterium cucumis]SHO72209.1 hypothetical protein SAMN05443547_0536 [Flavobacterium cucumis]